MALFSKNEFATKCGMTSGNLSVYISRGKVVLSGDMIDDSLDKNVTFINRRVAQGKSTLTEKIVTISAPENKQLSKKHNPDQVEFPFDNENKGSLSESERKLKNLDTIKREVEIEKMQFDLAKKRGEVIPSELIKPVFLQHNQSIITEFKNAADETIRTFSKKKELTIEEAAEMKGELISAINAAVKKAIEASVKSIDNIINEFAIKKGVGERNI